MIQLSKLTAGNTVAAVDELCLFLTNMAAIEYIRNGMKRVRKKGVLVYSGKSEHRGLFASRNQGIHKAAVQYSVPPLPVQCSQINPLEYMDALQLEESEFSLIRYPERGSCLYRCGNERYLLQIIAPSYKAALFGAAGGR